MSAPTTPTTAPASGGARGGKVMKAVAVLATVVALAFGATQISKSGTTTASTGSAPQSAQAAGPQSGMTPPGMGIAVTGTTLDKLEKAATAKYPGTVDRAMQLGDGSYVVHVMRSGGGEVHVLVSKDFTVTGTEQGPPAGAAPSSSSSSSQSS